MVPHRRAVVDAAMVSGLTAVCEDGPLRRSTPGSSISRIAPITLPSFRQLTRSGFSGWRMLLLAWLAVFFTGSGRVWCRRWW